MSYTIRHLVAVGGRALRQLVGDKRFLVLSLVAPLLVVYFFKLFFDSLESPGFKPTQYIVPIAAFIVHFITYLLCAIVLVRERTAQTLTRMFVNGYRQVEIIGGYLLAYTTLATLQSLLVLSELRILFNLDYSARTFLSLYVVIWLLAVISIALGIFISTFARNEGQVIPFIPLVILPSIFLSGLIISIDRLYGGQSTFKLGPWVWEYLRWFRWGARELRRKKGPRRVLVPERPALREVTVK